MMLWMCGKEKTCFVERTSSLGLLLGFVVVILFCSLTCGFYLQTSADYATKSFNFNWKYLYYYGDQPNNSSTNYLEDPYDFILSLDNKFLLVSEPNFEQIKQFAKRSLENYTVSPAGDGLGTASLEQTGQTSFAFGLNTAIKLFTGADYIDVNVDPSLTYVYGLCYDKTSSTLYASVPIQSRVLAFNISTGIFVRLYGKTNISDVSENKNATMENMGNPAHIRIDCTGNLWVADNSFNRIVRYKAGTNIPDLLWGQSSWTSSDYETAQNRFTSPQDIVFDTTCSVAFVAADRRVLLFRAPFVSYQSAEGVLGTTNFNSTGNFGFIQRLQLEETGYKKGLLYLLDVNNNKIVVGETQWNTEVYTIDCSGPLSAGENCIIQQIVALEGVVVTVPVNYTRIIIEASLTMDNITQLKMNSQQQIQTSGNVTIAGQLSIALSASVSSVLKQEGRVELTLITTNSTMRGKFSTVTLEEGEEGTEFGCGVTKEEEYTGKSLVLIISVKTCSEGKETLSNGAIVGIVIGVAGAVLIVIVIAGVGIGIVGWRIRRRVKKTLEDAQGTAL